MRILILLALILSSSCFALEKTFTYSCPDAIQKQVQYSIECWNKALGGMLHAKRIKDAVPDIIVTQVQNLPKYRGLTHTSSTPILIEIDQDCDYKTSVILHEFGHAFGLEHTKNMNSIMFHCSKNDPTLSREDEENIRKIWRDKK